MSAMTNLLVKDDAATVKEWTLVPVTDTPNSVWRANDSNIPLYGEPKLTTSVDLLKSGDYKITAKLEVPVMETLGASGTSAGYVAPPAVAYVDTVIVTMFASRRSTPQDRANALKMAAGFISGASSTTATGTLNQATAAQGWLNAALPGPQLFIAAVAPN